MSASRWGRAWHTKILWPIGDAATARAKHKTLNKEPENKNVRGNVCCSKSAEIVKFLGWTLVIASSCLQNFRFLPCFKFIKESPLVTLILTSSNQEMLVNLKTM